MILRKPARQALKILQYLAKDPNRRVGCKELARHCGTAPANLTEVLSGLARHGVVRTTRGPRGGYSLARSSREVNLREVVEIAHGPLFDNECILHEGPCFKYAACPVHAVWMQAQEELMRTLGRLTLADLTFKLEGAQAVDRLLADLEAERS